MNSEELPLQYRLGTPDDLPFVASSWFNSGRNNHNNNYIDKALYDVEQTAIIKKLLNQSLTFVACLEDNANIVIGYQVYQYLADKCFVHWSYTAGDSNLYRRQGIQSQILQYINPDNKLQLVITSFPRKKEMFEHLRYKFGAIYDPYFMMRLT